MSYYPNHLPHASTVNYLLKCMGITICIYTAMCDAKGHVAQRNTLTTKGKVPLAPLYVYSPII